MIVKNQVWKDNDKRAKERYVVVTREGVLKDALGRRFVWHALSDSNGTIIGAERRSKAERFEKGGAKGYSLFKEAT